MCEIYVRVRDRPESLLLMQRGDVIHVGEDGHQWGKAELASQDHRIIHIPGVPASEYEHLMAADIPEVFGDEPRHKRGMRLDLDALGIALTKDAHPTTKRQVDTLVVKTITEEEKPVDPTEPDGEKRIDQKVEWELSRVEIDSLEPITEFTGKQIQAAAKLKEFR